MPALAALAEAGVAADAVEGVTPASVYPAHATLVTGELPAEHGITADHMLGTAGRALAALLARDAPARGHALAAGQRGGPSGRGAGLAYHGGRRDRAAAARSRAGSRRRDTWLGVLADAASPELLALARARGGEAPAANAPGAAARRRAGGRRLLAARIGPSRPRCCCCASRRPSRRCSCTARAPPRRTRPSRRRIARSRVCSAACGAALLGDSAALFVVGDHGFAPVYAVLAPNTALAKAGLLTPVPGVAEGVTRWSAIARSNGGSAFVYAAGGARRGARAQDARKGSGAARRVPRGRRRRAAARRRRPRGLVRARGRAGLRVRRCRAGALSAARRDSRRPAAICLRATRWIRASSPGGAACARACGSRACKQIDVAPTAARLLGIDLGEVSGRPLLGALDLPPG